MALPKAVIAEVIALRNAGTEFEDIRKQINKQFKLKQTDDSIKHLWRRYRTIKQVGPVKHHDHLIIADVQAKPGLQYPHLHALGKLVVERRPDVIINIGDFYDMPSLSSYDSGLKTEGRRVKNDLLAGHEAMDILLAPLKRLQLQQAECGEPVYKPRMVYLIGNHEYRIVRHIESHANLEGMLSLDDLHTKDWEVIPFLEVVKIDGVAYSHYFCNPMTGKPYTGTMNTMIKNIGYSFTMGHQQRFEYGRKDLTDGAVLNGLVAGSFYMHDEDYKGPQGNRHWRGIAYKHNVRNGDYDVEAISLERVLRDYGGK